MFPHKYAQKSQKKKHFKADIFCIQWLMTRVDLPVEWPNGEEPLSTCVQI